MSTIRVPPDRYWVTSLRAGTAASVAASQARHAEITEDVNFLLSTGATAEDVAARLDTTVGALARRFYRHGQPDLARGFNRAEKATQRMRDDA